MDVTGPTAQIALSLIGFSIIRSAGRTGQLPDLLATIPSADSKIFFATDGLNGYFYPTPSGLVPYDGYASGNRQYLADTVALPGQGGTLDADKYYPGMSVWDSSLGKPKWWTGSGWWQPVAAPITPADTSFVQAAEGEYQQQPNFTNALNTADPDFKPNTRLNGSGGGTDVRTYTMWTSNYIGCKSGDVIRVRCPDGTFESGGGSIWPIAVQYNAMKESTGAVTYKATSGTSYDAVFDSDGKGFSITINDLSVAFIRIVGNGDAAGAIITKNQEIAYKQVWVGTPMQFGDEVKQNMANVFVQAPQRHPVHHRRGQQRQSVGQGIHAVITPPKAAGKEILHERKHDQGRAGGRPGACAYGIQLLVPVLVLLVVMVLDYITGMAKAWHAGGAVLPGGPVGHPEKGGLSGDCRGGLRGGLAAALRSGQPGLELAGGLPVCQHRHHLAGDQRAAVHPGECFGHWRTGAGLYAGPAEKAEGTH